MTTTPKPPMTPIEPALDRLLEHCLPPPAVVRLPLLEADGRVLAEDVLAQLDVPPSANSAMDGYCFRFADLASGQPLPVSQRIPAGVAPSPLEPGTAGQIFTGAALPAGADTVVMQEQTVCERDAVEFTADSIELGQNVRPQGQDIQSGSVLLPKGTRIRPQQQGLLASAGIATVPVFKPLTVALVITGDELVAPGDPLPEGKIYNSNRFLLTGLLKGLGMEIMDLGTVPDNLEATLAAFESAAKADLVISSGGVSVGEEDYVKAALRQLGTLELWQLAIKPGKPFAFGKIGNTPFMGLPGNPAAVLVTFCMLCRPWLLRSQGLNQWLPRTRPIPVNFSNRGNPKRQEYLRVQFIQDEQGRERLEAHPNQSSGMLSSACWADGLAIMPPGQLVTQGDELLFLDFNQLLC